MERGEAVIDGLQGLLTEVADLQHFLAIHQQHVADAELAVLLERIDGADGEAALGERQLLDILQRQVRRHKAVRA